MGRRGKKRQLEVEARYWQLLESGVGIVEACRRVAMLGREPVALGRVGRGWRPTPSCAPWCRTSSSWSGVPN